MTIEGLSKVETSSDLVNAIKQASERKMSSNELLEQRASFVYGSIKQRAGLTKAEIKRYLIDTQGGATESPRDSL